METYLGHLELGSSDGLTVSDGQVGRERGMPDDGRQRIPVLMRQPFTTNWKHPYTEVSGDGRNQNRWIRTISSSPHVLRGVRTTASELSEGTHLFRYTERELNEQRPVSISQFKVG